MLGALVPDGIWMTVAPAVGDGVEDNPSVATTDSRSSCAPSVATADSRSSCAPRCRSQCVTDAASIRSAETPFARLGDPSGVESARLLGEAIKAGTATEHAAV
jgi:hypothetical protein